MVRAKFKCDSVGYYPDTCTVSLSPVTNGSEENKTFYKYTPGGKIELSVVDKKTAELFEPGKEYYVDFSKAEA
jgi:hypothetical protein